MARARRLAAIMFTDMVGFTALTQDDEPHALVLLETHQRLLRPIFAEFGGREIKTIGDSFLVEFDSALDATRCAIEVQHRLAEYDGSAPERDRFRIRIGIHLGDVIHLDNDVLGDAINLASRIEPFAEPGGICVSEPIFDQIRNKIPNPLSKLASVDLKNVKFPIDLYKIELGMVGTGHGDVGTSGVSQRRLAVLPLANMSPDPQDEFFADGLTEEIMSELATVPGLRVIARTSVMRFRGGGKGVSEIGRELHVGTVLEGSVRRAGNRIRITAQLVDTGTEEHLWSGRFDRELVDVFAIQTEIAKEVATALKIAVHPSPITGRRSPPSLNAFQAYLRGRHLWNRRSEEHIRAALRCFEEALHLDPSYAEAYSGIADCYSILVDWGAMRPSEGSPRAQAAAERAVQLDETMAEAHASLGLALTRSYHWEDAVREFERALELNPMYASAHQWYYMDLMCRGRRDEAARELRRAEEADPLSPIILFHKGFFAWMNGQEDAMLASWDRISELGEDESLVGLHKLLYYAWKGKHAEALELLPKMAELSRGVLGKATPAIAHGFLGQRAEARRELALLLAGAKERYVPAFQIAWIQAAVGDTDQFFEWLLRSADEMGNNPYEIICCPVFEKQRADPRFQEYLRRCRLAG